jgi:cellulose synthase/poly-beta-1,6-N-acetylglucosamine synthase-like glycosyltransferase
MIVFYSILLIYSLLILSFRFGFGKVKTSKAVLEKPSTCFSILIPFRNEEKALPQLLKSLNTINYPSDLYEIIFINDASEDNSVSVIKNSIKNNNYQLINNIRTSNSPKKDALTHAIKQSKYPWIITTDADCVLPKNWLNSFASFIQENEVKFIAAPVAMQLEKGIWTHFQTHDFLALQGITIGAFGLRSPFLCNGANLCYKKTAFNAVNGFEGNTNLASGDDVFLLEKMNKKFPKQTAYLKDEQAIVTTFPVATFQDLKQQRIRWASKANAYKNSLAIFSGFTMLAMSLSLVYSVLSFNLELFTLLFISKFLIDLVLIYPTDMFFKQENSLKTLIWSSFVYPFFTLYIGFLSLFKNYQWKGRKLQ